MLCAGGKWGESRVETSSSVHAAWNICTGLAYLFIRSRQVFVWQRSSSDEMMMHEKSAEVLENMTTDGDAATAHAPAATHVNQWNKSLIRNWEKWFHHTRTSSVAWRIIRQHRFLKIKPRYITESSSLTKSIHTFDLCPFVSISDSCRIFSDAKFTNHHEIVFHSSHIMSFRSPGATAQLKEFLWGEHVIHVLLNNSPLFQSSIKTQGAL